MSIHSHEAELYKKNNTVSINAVNVKSLRIFTIRRMNYILCLFANFVCGWRNLLYLIKGVFFEAHFLSFIFSANSDGRVLVGIMRFLSVFVVQCIYLFSVSSCELNVDTEYRILNGFIDYLNNLPNQPYVYEDGTLVNAENTVSFNSY